MIEDSKVIKVRNRDNGTVGYTIPDLGNLHRNFQSGEIKDITMKELRKLSYIPGGDVTLRNYLVIENPEAVAELLGEVEPEYNYTEAEIKELLEHGTLNQFLDALDFAPDGVIELIKDLAVKTELNDVAKREAILKRIGFNVTKAIEINKETAEQTIVEEKQRRSTPIKTEDVKPEGRRTSAPISSKYKITSIGK